MKKPIGQKVPRFKDAKHLRAIRMCPCLVCGSLENVEAAHIRYGDPEFGKPPTGLGMRPGDDWAVPLCRACHRDGANAQHKKGERKWWVSQGINPLPIAQALYALTPYEHMMAREMIEMTRKQREQNDGRL